MNTEQQFEYIIDEYNTIKDACIKVYELWCKYIPYESLPYRNMNVTRMELKHGLFYLHGTIDKHEEFVTFRIEDIETYINCEEEILKDKYTKRQAEYDAIVKKRRENEERILQTLSETKADLWKEYELNLLKQLAEKYNLNMIPM